MPTPFCPDQLTPAASLNRVRIVDLPGVVLDPEVRGRLAYDLLSTAALAGHLRRHAGALGMEDVDTLEDAALPPILDRCFRSADPSVRATAETIARSFGRALAFLLLVLKRGDAPNRQARDDWDDSYWAHWRGIRQVVLGGGLVSGSLGRHLLPYMQDLLTQYGADCSVEVARHASLLPLIGGARSLPAGLSAALVCDFGQSRIKRACAIFQDGTLLVLRTLPAVPVAWAMDEGVAQAAGRAERLAGSMARSILATHAEARNEGIEIDPAVVVSVASYVEAGRPLPRQGGPFADMHMLDLPLDRWLAARLSERMKQPVELTLLHDGTAAARAYGEAAGTTVIMLGTALGIGFPSGVTAIRPLSPAFAVMPL